MLYEKIILRDISEYKMTNLKEYVEIRLSITYFVHFYNQNDMAAFRVTHFATVLFNGK